MPNYDFACPLGHVQEATVSYEARDSHKETCRVCGKGMRRLFSAPRLLPSRFPYVHDNLDMNCPVTIHNRKQEAEEFKKRKLINVGTK